MWVRWYDCMAKCDFYVSTAEPDCADHDSFFWPRRAYCTCYIHAHGCTMMLHYVCAASSTSQSVSTE